LRRRCKNRVRIPAKGTALPGLLAAAILAFHCLVNIWHSREEVMPMLRWALSFFIVAMVAALLGFTGIAVAAAGIAKILFYLFLILFLVTLVGHLLRRT
jgi:uncharacterized membrane protein YtjA (UPF0391 family)